MRVIVSADRRPPWRCEYPSRRDGSGASPDGRRNCLRRLSIGRAPNRVSACASSHPDIGGAWRASVEVVSEELRAFSRPTVDKKRGHQEDDQ